MTFQKLPMKIVVRKKVVAILMALSSVVSASVLAAQGSGVLNMTNTTNLANCALNAGPYYTTCAPDVNGKIINGAAAITIASSATVGGELHAGSSVVYTNGTQAEVLAIARAGYFDALTITRMTEPTFVSFSLSAHGFTGNTQLNPAFASYGIFNIYNYGAKPMPESYYLNSPLVSSGKQFQALGNIGVVNDVVTIPVFLGVNNLAFLFSAVSVLNRPADTPTGAWSGSAYADYMNTASVTGFQFINANGQDISNSVTASFAAPFQVVPEPSTLVLTGAVLFGLFAAGALRKRRQ